MTGAADPIRSRASGNRSQPGLSPTPSALVCPFFSNCRTSIQAGSGIPRCAPCSVVSRSYVLAFCSPLTTKEPRNPSTGSPRLRSCAQWPWWELSENQGEDPNHALRWCSLASPWNPLHPSSLGLLARFAETRGQPLDQASEPCPSDSLAF
jgi:hypothetical protein